MALAVELAALQGAILEGTQGVRGLMLSQKVVVPSPQLCVNSWLVRGSWCGFPEIMDVS